MALEGLINVITLVPGSAKTPKTPHAHHYALELDSSFFLSLPLPVKAGLFIPACGAGFV